MFRKDFHVCVTENIKKSVLALLKNFYRLLNLTLFYPPSLFWLVPAGKPLAGQLSPSPNLWCAEVIPDINVVDPQTAFRHSFFSLKIHPTAFILVLATQPELLFEPKQRTGALYPGNLVKEAMHSSRPAGGTRGTEDAAVRSLSKSRYWSKIMYAPCSQMVTMNK